MRTDQGASQAHVAAIAGIDRSHYTRIEAGIANANIETLVAISIALGGDLSVRFYPGTGPRLTDRHQARMVEAICRILHPTWTPHVEVPVSRPARGVIDLVPSAAAKAFSLPRKLIRNSGDWSSSCAGRPTRRLRSRRRPLSVRDR
jgi:transcriptional regulator with XRE-family HTH domain